MGAKVSHAETVVGCNPDGLPETVDNRISSDPEPQRNDNATKMVGPSEAVRRIPSHLETANLQSIKCSHSRTEPLICEHNCRLMREANQYWSEQSVLREGACTNFLTKKSPKPPWKPNSMNHNKTYFNARIEESLLRQPLSSRTRMMKSTPRGRLDLSSRSPQRKSVSSSLASLLELSSHPNEAHLRCCAAARRVYTGRSDAFDSISVDTGTSRTLPSNRFTPRTTCCVNKSAVPLSSLTSKRCRSCVPRQNRSETETLSSFYRRRASQPMTSQLNARSMKSTLSQPSDDTSPPSLQDDTFPLRYIFYIEEGPSSKGAFTRGGVVSSLARETRCRVYLHAQHTLDPMTASYNHCRRCQGELEKRSIEPALYYQGKRVYPVTVAAPNLTRLRRFLQYVDAYHPEFNATAFLSDKLVVSTNTLLKEPADGDTN